MWLVGERSTYIDPTTRQRVSPDNGVTSHLVTEQVYVIMQMLCVKLCLCVHRSMNVCDIYLPWSSGTDAKYVLGLSKVLYTNQTRGVMRMEEWKAEVSLCSNMMDTEGQSHTSTQHV